MATEKHGGDIIFRRQQFSVDGTDLSYDATKKNGTSLVGRWCTLSDDMEVQLAADGEDLIGPLESISPSGLASLVVDGTRVTCLPGDSVTLVRGQPLVGALGASSAKGYVRNPVVVDTVVGILERVIAKGNVIDVANAVVQWRY